MKSFNMNNYVKVKLTDKGRDIYFHQYDKINKDAEVIMIEPQYPKEDGEGFFKDQLWNLIKTFGNYIGMGFENPFGTELVFDDKDLLDVSL